MNNFGIIKCLTCHIELGHFKSRDKLKIYFVKITVIMQQIRFYYYSERRFSKISVCELQVFSGITYQCYN